MPAVDVIDGIEGVQRYIDGIAADFRQIDFQPFGRLELFELADVHAGYFADASDPIDAKWPELAPSTVARKGHATILVETDRLKSSLTEKIAGGVGDAVRDVVVLQDETDILFGTMVEYSGYHDSASGNRPARRHVGVNDQFLDNFCDRLIRYAINELAAIQ